MKILSPLRVAFMGSPDFAVTALEALRKTGHLITAVYCQSPKPAGRGHHVQKTPVQIAAEKANLPIFSPRTLRDPVEHKHFAALKLDVAVVAAYGLILPKPILAAPRFGCINIHASLLPRWRGAAPIQRAILAGDRESGVTIMQMDEGLDTGAMLYKDTVPLTDATTTQSLHDDLALRGARLMTQTLADLVEGSLQPIIQPEREVTYATKLSRDDGKIDWTRPADFISRQARALNPWPGCYFLHCGEVIKVLDLHILQNHSGIPGTLLDEHLTIACGEQAVRLTTVQRAGKKPTDGASFLRGLRLPVGGSL